MAEFISTFTTGFQTLVEKTLVQTIKGVKIINIYDGMVHYRFDGNSRVLENVIYFNNTFFLLKFFNGKNNNFKFMINSVSGSKNYFLINKGSFRIRFNQENQFTKVDKNLSRKAEEHVLKNSRLSIDRVNPSTEIWYCIRREGFGFCGQLISKREFTEKNLNKGELRPEVAYFMTVFAELENEMTAGDFFAGYGSIPVQIAKQYNLASLFVSDISTEQVNIMKNKAALQKDYIHLSVNDAFKLADIPDKFLDRIITDPPWGYYEEIPDVQDFYARMFVSFDRILKDNGKMVILSARKNELEAAVQNSSFEISALINTLVNGKKASLYLLVRKN